MSELSEPLGAPDTIIRRSRFHFAVALLVLSISAPPGHSAEVLFTAFRTTGAIRTIGPTDEPTRTALKTVVGRIQELEQMTSLHNADKPGSVAQINRDAATEPIRVDPVLAELLQRALGFCRWSDGMISPLGGAFYDLWDRHVGTERGPATTALAHALETASCERLTFDRDEPTVKLREGSLIDLRNFAMGSAIDQAVASLRGLGFESASVRIGNVERSFGPGPNGKGWIIHLPADLGFESPLTPIYLEDRAIALAHKTAPPEQIGHRFDLRSGRAATGVWSVVTSTELATDAQGLAAAMFVGGSREGEMRLGALRPSPSVLWHLGTGTGRPVINSYRWSHVSSK